MVCLYNSFVVPPFYISDIIQNKQVFNTTLVFLTGEIKVNCYGELREARCDVFDQHNGIYKVHLYPREACRHRLEITYDQEHVPGIVENVDRQTLVSK
jgi:hypothetical protein